jgi:hypothetical protein
MLSQSRGYRDGFDLLKKVAEFGSSDLHWTLRVEFIDVLGGEQAREEYGAITPKALANFSPVVGAQATTLGNEYKKGPLTLKALGLCGNNPCRVETKCGDHDPGLLLRSNPGL